MIYSIGGAGYLNFGDELMVKAWLDWWAGHCPDMPVVVDGASGPALEGVFAADYPGAVWGDAVNRLAKRGDTHGVWEAAKRGLTFHDRGGFDHYPNLSEQAERLKAAKIIHLHGGGYLNNHFARKGFLLGLAVATARQTGARLVGTGLGLVPLAMPEDNDRAMIAAAIEQFDMIETRDSKSAELLRQIAPDARIVDGLDDTFMADLPFTRDGKHRLHISMNEKDAELPVFEALKRYILARHGDYDEVVFWRCAPNDAGTWRRLEGLDAPMRKIDFDHLVLQPMPVNPGDHMFTGRFHPHMIGGRGGATGVYFSLGKYYDVKHGSVAKLGSGFQPFEGGTLTPEMLSAGTNTMAEAAPALVTRKRELAAHMFR